MNITTIEAVGLDALTAQIRNDIERRERSREEWVEATADLSLHLVDARMKFPGDTEFGSWFETSGFEINKNERAALIAMGKEPERMQEVLEATKSRSVELIYRKEFRIPSTRKAKPAKPKTTPELEKALHAYDRRKLAGEDLTYEAIMAEAGVSSTPVRRAIAIREAATDDSQADAIVLSLSAQEKFDAKVRAFKRNFDFEVETKARAEARKRLEELYIPNYMQLLRKVEGMLKWTRGIMSRADYRKIIRCLHPDTGAHVSDANRNEAFRLFTQYEARLVADQEQADIKKVSSLPQTVEEMMARKRRRGA